MTSMPYRLTDATGPTLGLIVLQPDETIERDFRRIFAANACQFHVTRVPSGDAVTPGSLAQMAHDVPQAAALLPRAATFDVVGYACTSGATVIGAKRVAELVRGAVDTPAVTDPLTAALAAIRALGLQRIGIVSPYIAAVAQPLRAAFETHGIEVPDTLSFGEDVEAHVARIDPHSIAEATRVLAQRTRLEGVFLSCTNLRTLDVISDLEAELGLPVLSSNQVLAWHMSKLAPAPDAVCPGRLFAKTGHRTTLG